LPREHRSYNVAPTLRGAAVLKLLRSYVALIALTACAHAQTPASPPTGEGEAVGLFTLTCIRLGGDPAAVREFMKQKNIPELPPIVRDAVMRNRQGVGFNVSTKETHMAVISEDNGWCSVFAETVDTTKIAPLVEQVAKVNHLTLSEVSQQEKDNGLTSHHYKLTVKDHVFTLAVSTGTRPDAPFHAFLTLAP
jgi:hypothetical protein